MISLIGIRWTSTSNMLFSTLSGSTPWLIVRLPCGSMSTASTRWPDSLKATARLSAVVVLATPPFWLAKAITFAGPSFLGASGCFAFFESSAPLLASLSGLPSSLRLSGLRLDQVLGPHAAGSRPLV